MPPGRFDRQQIQQHLEQAAVSRLVHRRGHHNGTGPRHLRYRCGNGRMPPLRQQQRLGGQLADVQAVDR